MPLLRHACLLLLLLAAVPVSAQRFNIAATPKWPTVLAGQTATITISVLPIEGFDATVFLTVSAPTLSPTNVVLAQERLNSPYTPGATLSITPTGGDVGLHTIIIEGRNSSVITYDTVVLRVRPVTGADEWTSYHMANSDLRSLTITAIDFDRFGTAFIGTNAGLVRALPGEAPRSAGDPLAFTPIIALAIDSSYGIWVAHHQGIARLVNGDTIDYPLPVEHWQLHRELRALAVAPDGSVWVGTANALFHLKEDVWTLYTSADWGAAIGNAIVDIAITSTGDVWASTAGQVAAQDGILKYDGSFWTTFTLDELGIGEHSSRADLAIGDSDRVWTATWDGMASPSGPTVITRPSNGSRLVAVAPGGQLWLGSNYPSVTEQIVFSEQGTSWKSHPLSDAGLPGGALPNHMEVHANGSIWIGTDNHGLAVLHPGSGTVGIDAPEHAASSRQISITPNPLLSSGTIGVSSNGGAARISLHDNVGRQVAVLYRGVLLPGEQSVQIDLSGIAAGAYLLSVDVGGEICGSRMIVVAPR